jgi:hypothetical protein
MSDGGKAEQVKRELAEVLGLVWNHVVKQVNRLIETHEKFGFMEFKENLNPSLEDVIRGFEFIDYALSQLLDSKLLEHDETRIAINSKQCILKIRELSLACDGVVKDEYDRVINDLKNQSLI